MSVQYATGFGGLNLATPARYTATYTWPFVANDGMTLKTQVAAANGPLVYGLAGIVVDPTFPTRKLLQYTYTNAVAGAEFVGLGVPGAPDNQKGVVLGFTFSESYSGTTPAANAAAPYRHGLAVVSSTGGKAASTTMSLIDPKQGLLVLGDALSAGSPARFPLCVYGRNTFTRPASVTKTYAIDMLHQVEVMIERASKRVRVYLDDELVQDFVFDGADISTVMNGLQIVTWRDGSYSTSYRFTVDIGNIYMIALDDVHTERLGSSARVVDYAPASDRSVEMVNSNEDASGNYQTADQVFDAASEYALMSKEGGSSDLYGIPQSLFTDAAAIHGVGIKVSAVDVGGGGHNIASLAEKDGKTAQGPSAPISVDMTTVFSDASVNPSTGAKWQVSELTTGSIGFRGGFK